MRSRVLLILSVFILIPAVAYSSLKGEIKLSLVEGDVQVRPEGTEEWFPASINTPVLEGDKIWVPDGGRLEIQIRDGSIVRLNESTSFDILRIEDESLQYYLDSGSTYVNFSGKKRYLQIDAAGASIRVYERSKFRIDVSEDGRIDVSTYSGNVYVETARGRSSVRAGNMLVVRDQEYAELSPLGPSDEWERWNRERDRRFTKKRYNYRYLPDELIPYSYDLDENGRWVYVREYGYVWTPTVMVSVGWAPYRHGRWVWIGGDYVWISYEPWGWVPYHYGRWAFVASIGWCWVPPARGAVYWGPGFVGWVYTPTYIAWVPLAPGEIYYGYGYYGPHSVNIINIDIHKVVVKEYRHAHIKDAITIVHRDTFLKGKPVEVKVHENPFLAHKIHIGRPPLEPVRETRSPAIKEIIRGKEPPQRIREFDLKRLREHRPIVKEKDLSVIRPGERLRDFSIENLRKPLRPEEGLKGKTIRPFEDKGQGPSVKPKRSLDERFRLNEREMKKPEMQGPGKIRKGFEDKGKGIEGIKDKKDKGELKDQGINEPKGLRDRFEGRGGKGIRGHDKTKDKSERGIDLREKGEGSAPPSEDKKSDIIRRLREKRQ